MLLPDQLVNLDDTRRDIVYDELNDLASGRALDETQQTIVAKSTLARLPEEQEAPGTLTGSEFVGGCLRLRSRGPLLVFTPRCI